jgi:uncharacterized cupredoxin-like copper-binding protein
VKRTCASLLLPLMALAWGSTLPVASILFQASAHEGHEHFTAGEPGDPKRPARIVKVTMLEEGKQMLFEPAVVEVRLGEQIRFVIYNEETWNHEFILATRADNRKHGELMKKFRIWSTTIPTPCDCRLSPPANSSGNSPKAVNSNTLASFQDILKRVCMARSS